MWVRQDLLRPYDTKRSLRPVDMTNAIWVETRPSEGDTMNELTVKCPICEKPYKVFPNYAGDQSACPKCRQEAERNSYLREPSRYQQ